MCLFCSMDAHCIVARGRAARSIRQHPSAYVRTREDTSEYVSKHEHTLAYVTVAKGANDRDKVVLIVEVSNGSVYSPNDL